MEPALSNAELLNTALLSVQVAGLGTLAVAPFAIALGWVLARKDFRGRALVEAAVSLPLVLPPVVTGYALLVLLGRSGILPTGLPFTQAGAALVAGVMGFPLFVRAVRIAVEGVDPRLEDAARTLGASPLQTARRVTLPLARSGVGAGLLLCFARALGEFGATITFAGNLPGETRTLTLAIWSAIQTPGGQTQAARFVMVSVLLAVAATIAGEWLARRRS